MMSAPQALSFESTCKIADFVEMGDSIHRRYYQNTSNARNSQSCTIEHRQPPEMRASYTRCEEKTKTVPIFFEKDPFGASLNMTTRAVRLSGSMIPPRSCSMIRKAICNLRILVRRTFVSPSSTLGLYKGMSLKILIR